NSYPNATEEELKAAKAAAEDNVSFYMFAEELGQTLTSASGFAIGGKSAVGAAAAVNYADSNVAVNMEGTAKIAGVARLKSHVYNRDDAYGIATAMGADMNRKLDKINEAEETTEKVLNGNYPTSKKATKNAEAQGGKPAKPSTDAATEGKGNDEVTNTNGMVDKTNANANDNNASQMQSTGQGSIDVAAAVAVNITGHIASTLIKGIIDADSAQIYATNNGNFRTRASGASITLAKSDASVGAAVAISVDKNKAETAVEGTVCTNKHKDEGLTAEERGKDLTGDIIIESLLTANMDDVYRGSLGAQAVAGAV
ncbi:MAG: hypothetical protein Q4A15_04725, partial [Prevotellaceae bacterium]|nr:hypothetical protein [Prevotellaceae bacterium]